MVSTYAMVGGDELSDAERDQLLELCRQRLDAFKQSLLEVLHQELFAPNSIGEQLWAQGSVSRLLANGSLGARTAGLLALIETPEALEGYLLRAQSQDDAKRRAQRCIEAVQEATRLALQRSAPR